MSPGSLIEFSAAAFSGVIAGAVLFRRRRVAAGWFFFAGMLGFAIDSVLAGIASNAQNPEELVYWNGLELVVKSMLPAIWLGFSLTYSRGNYVEFLQRWKWTLFVIFLLPILLAVGCQEDLFRFIMLPDSNQAGRVMFGNAGKALNAIFLVSAILTLMNLEKTFRTAVGTMRWRIKFVVLGLYIIFGTKFYVSGQSLVYSSTHLPLLAVEAAALIVGCALIVASYLRTGLIEIDVYPSHTFLFGSITVLLAGIYLLVVGLLSHIVVALGGDTTFPIHSFLILLGIVGLAVLLLSDRARQTTQRFISRNFKRPLYDSRKVWSSFTETTARAADEAALCNVSARMISDTFNVLSVTVWLVDDQHQLSFAASTVLLAKPFNNRVKTIAESETILAALRAGPPAFDLEIVKEEWARPLREANPANFANGGDRYCVPIIAGGQLLGAIVLADRVNGLPFSVEELDLLRCIGNHVAANLLGLQLSEKLVEAREHEAFRTVSAFFAHDLKNAASTLSLMLKNLPLHFEDPAFREDVLRGISKTVNHMNHLIGRLSVLGQKPEMHKVRTDLNHVVDAALARWKAVPEIQLTKQFDELPPLSLDPDQIQNVITNLVLNAGDAINHHGAIRVATTRKNGWAVLTVTDNGTGMTPDFVRQSLFRPFQTTKIGGTGIGMFQCKMIVEAHSGKIEVESEPGKGTSFHVLLPI
jgi:putative PEP-CTERM system histidine kinase